MCVRHLRNSASAESRLGLGRLRFHLDLRGAARSVVCPPGPVTGLSLLGLMNKLWPTARIRRAAGPSCMVVGQPPTAAIPARAPWHPDSRGHVTCCPLPSPCRGTQAYVNHRARMWTTRVQSRVPGAGDAEVMTNSAKYNCGNLSFETGFKKKIFLFKS